VTVLAVCPLQLQADEKRTAPLHADA
jgi:hypothetical protein